MGQVRQAHFRLAHPAFSVNIYAQRSIKRPNGISSSHLYMSNIERTVFFAECHFLLTLTVKEASLDLAALRRFLPVLRLSRGERPSAVMTEDRLARVEGCRMLQFTLSDIFRLKIRSTKFDLLRRAQHSENSRQYGYIRF